MALHKELVENVLCGLDINPHAVQLAACNLTLGAPTVDYQRMNLATMPHGPVASGEVKAGSLEILDVADGSDLAALISPERNLGALDASQVDAAGEINFPLRDLDVIIMNPPFSDVRKRGRKYSPEITRAMQAREMEIRSTVSNRDVSAGDVITTNSIQTFFIPIVDRLLNPTHGTLATVLPVTACIGVDATAQRRFLAERFHVERVVVSHDHRSKKGAFSGNTGIHECLLIARRRPQGDPCPDTEFVSLRKMPETADEAAKLTDAISGGEWEKVGRLCRWPEDRMRSGDWSPAQWYDPELSEIVLNLEMRPDLVRSGEVITIGASVQQAHPAWKRFEEGEKSEEQIMIFDSISAKKRRTMLGVPEQTVVPADRNSKKHVRVLATKGHLMFAQRYDTLSGRLTALYSEVATIGFGWMPITGKSREIEKGICAWWNSTPGRLLLLNRRAKKLTYPAWSKDHLRSMPIPTDVSALTAAWEAHKDDELLPLRDEDRCPVRLALDEAAAAAIGEDPAVIADWRRRLAAESTISGRMAPDPARGDDDGPGRAE